ncbi:MAG: class I SAM-dependent methyltransferase [Advenella sp.]|uniref:rRNA methyltransferase n=1 Tax=Advenella kashmirensis TaxID=310575 RepID=A0A356LE02_9BURK|nr:rRNA methyltransferase [Advenella kashmirensis]
MPLLKTVTFVHTLLAGHVVAGARVIDATMGNGHDTLQLARLVGDTGHVYAFDIQSEALAATAARLGCENLRARATLIQDSHARMLDYLSEPINAIVFNLGYLPGADKSCATQATSTLAAVRNALTLLAPGGLLLITIYWGHPAGASEKKVLEPFVAQLSPEQYRVLKYEFINRANPAPYLLAIERFTN